MSDPRWKNGQYPSPAEFDAMSHGEFWAYMDEIGFTQRINSALAPLEQRITDLEDAHHRSRRYGWLHEPYDP